MDASDNPPVKIRIKLHDNGPALWPERFSEKQIRRIETTLGSYYFSALYQGRPSPEGGGLFKKSWFKYWRDGGEFFILDGRTVRKAYCRFFGTVDLAFSVKTSADWTWISAWAVTPDCDLILIDMHRERMTGDQLVPSIRNMVDRHNLEYTGIEDVQAQTLVVQTARRNGLTVRALKANMDKITRSIPVQIRMEAGQVYFPLSHPHLDALETELLTFPQGATDDGVDNLAYAGLEVQRLGGAVIPAEERERMERERLDREWQAKVARNQEALSNWDNDHWYNDANWN